MPLWKKIWLLFAVIWVVVATLNVVTILAFAEEEERAKAWLPAFYGLAVPAGAYLLAWLWARWRAR